LIDSPRAASVAAHTAAAAGEDVARFRPMPTDCEPWPGKTKGGEGLGPEPRGTGCRRPGFACMLACMTETRVRPTTRPAPRRQIAERCQPPLSAPVRAAGPRLPNVGQISERVVMGRALWHELVIGFASQL